MTDRTLAGDYWRPGDKLRLPDEEWRRRLTPEQYRITREAGTERPFTGEYNGDMGAGVYRCVACDLALFGSDSKFNSHCGWPSFFQPMDPERIEERADTSHGMHRTEVRCPRCEAHLGHVFTDGPPPTGLRYCINSAALKFQPAPDPVP